MWTMTTVTRRTPTCTRSEHACALFRLSRHSHWHITFHLAQGPLSLSSHPHAMHMCGCLWVAPLLFLPHFAFHLPLPVHPLYVLRRLWLRDRQPARLRQWDLRHPGRCLPAHKMGIWTARTKKGPKLESQAAKSVNTEAKKNKRANRPRPLDSWVDCLDVLSAENIRENENKRTSHGFNAPDVVVKKRETERRDTSIKTTVCHTMGEIWATETFIPSNGIVEMSSVFGCAFSFFESQHIFSDPSSHCMKFRTSNKNAEHDRQSEQQESEMTPSQSVSRPNSTRITHHSLHRLNNHKKTLSDLCFSNSSTHQSPSHSYSSPTITSSSTTTLFDLSRYRPSNTTSSYTSSSSSNWTPSSIDRSSFKAASEQLLSLSALSPEHNFTKKSPKYTQRKPSSTPPRPRWPHHRPCRTPSQRCGAFLDLSLSFIVASSASFTANVTIFAESSIISQFSSTSQSTPSISLPTSSYFAWMLAEIVIAFSVFSLNSHTATAPSGLSRLACIAGPTLIAHPLITILFPASASFPIPCTLLVISSTPFLPPANHFSRPHLHHDGPSLSWASPRDPPRRLLRRAPQLELEKYRASPHTCTHILPLHPPTKIIPDPPTKNRGVSHPTASNSSDFIHSFVKLCQESWTDLRSQVPQDETPPTLVMHGPPSTRVLLTTKRLHNITLFFFELIGTLHT